jgi:hypothetical protein
MIFFTCWSSTLPPVIHGRDAALRYCNVESKRHPPGKYYDYDSQQNFWYRSCMYELGQAP